MNGYDLENHFEAQGTWIDWENTTDGFKAGDPSAPVSKVAVAWKANWTALRRAVELEADLFVSHESIAVGAVNNSGRQDVEFALPSERPKFDWLERTGLPVYRCHDLWDRFAGEGIRDSWQRGLQLGGEIAGDAFPLYVTEIEPMSVEELARRVLGCVRPLGQEGVLVSGRPEKQVHRVATGTGVTTDPVAMIALGADVGIITDDYYLHVRMGEHARELDFPTITVNHGVAEEWGVANLAAYLERTFPELQVFHIPQSCPYAMVTDS